MSSSVSAQPKDVPREAGDITYLTGGVGQESMDSINSQEKDYDLKLFLVTKSGPYLSGVDVQLADMKGKVLIEEKSDGPVFLVKLPAGNYQVTAKINGQTIRRQTDVSTGKSSTIYLRFADE